MCSERNLPFHIAAAHGCKEVFLESCNDPESVNKANFFGWTPLMLAAHNGHLQIVNHLLSVGADVSMKNMFGGSAMTVAAACKQEDVLRALVRHGRMPDEAELGAALAIAASYGFISIARYLIDCGANLNSSSPTSGVVPLMLAVAENNVEVVQLLVDRGADINCRNHAGYSALDLAILQNNFSIASYLSDKLDDKNDPASQICQRKEAVVEAAGKGDINSLKRLLSKNPALSTSQHWSFAVEHSVLCDFQNDIDNEVFDVEDGIFPSKKYELSKTFYNCETPKYESSKKQCLSNSRDLFRLHCISGSGCTCYTNDHKIPRFNSILSTYKRDSSSRMISVNNRNADFFLKGDMHSNIINFPNSEAKNESMCVPRYMKNCEQDVGEIVSSPLMLACINGHIEAAHLLVASGADPNRQRKGRTPLMISAITSNVELSQFLITSGADPFAESSMDNLTAFELATLFGVSIDIIRILAKQTVPVLSCLDFSPNLSMKLDCQLTPLRILKKLQSAISRKKCCINDTMFSQVGGHFKDALGIRKPPLAHWPNPPKKMTRRRLFFPSDHNSCVDKGELANFSGQLNSTPGHKIPLGFAKGISQTVCSKVITDIPLDFPLTSDSVYQLNPPRLLHFSEFGKMVKGRRYYANLKSSLTSVVDETSEQMNIKVGQITQFSPSGYNEAKNTAHIVESSMNEPWKSNYPGEDFKGYIREHGLEGYKALFERNEVDDVKIMISINENDLEEMGVLSSVERQEILNKIHRVA